MGFRSLSISFLLILLAFLTAGCGRSQTPEVFTSQVAPVVDQGQVYPLDPLFIEFYNRFQAVRSLGPAITPRLEADGIVQQYLESGLLVYDPSLPEGRRIHLEALGRDFGIAEPPIRAAKAPGTLFLNGHQISGDFLALYNQLGGEQVVGLPLTEARYNLENQRLEQYFENLGFYQLEDVSDEVHLMAYGLYACDRRCRYQAPLASIPVSPVALDEPFASEVTRLGWQITGHQLARPQPGWDGREEVIFENLVLVADKADPQKAVLRPIVALLEPPARSYETALPGGVWYFYPLQGDLGFNIPVFFKEYLQRSGGFDFSGPPVGGVEYHPEGFYQQCFANLCLDYDPSESEANTLQLAPMGKLYLDHFGERPGVSFYKSQSLENVDIKVWEGSPWVTSEQSQDIHVAIIENTIPLVNREPVLIVTMPDGSQKTYRFPPTDESGRAVLNVPPYPASNGTLVLYSVCLYGAGGGEKCTKDFYQIWNNPN